MPQAPSIEGLNQNEEFMRAEGRHKFNSACGRYIYHVAIIDYLTTFNTAKKLESNFKIYFMRKDEKLISAVEPVFYASRFLEFMGK
jgi:hypothetical protein